MKPTALSIDPEKLMEQIVEDANMALAWKNVEANRGAPGPDGITIAAFPELFRTHWPIVRQQLLNGTYKPSAARRKSIPKEDGSERHLGIPNVQERLIQQAIMQVLTPIFDPGFSESSFGFRPKRSAHGATKQVQQHIQAGYRHCVDMDLSKFFDNISHKLIVGAVAEEVADGNILRLLERFLAAGVMENGVFKPTTIGTPQGGVISPLLANIVLNKLDWRLEEQGYRFVRYADDFVVVCETPQQANAALTFVEEVMTELGLALSHEKTKIASYGKGYEFLGFRISSRSRSMRPKSLEKFKTKIRELTRRWNNLDETAIAKLNQVIRGTANYFAPKFSTCVRLFQKLDKWIRMRVRCMKFKRKSECDHYRLRQRSFDNKLGLLKMLAFTQTTM
jgi:group II intron reverse transcriptase/maturase